MDKTSAIADEYGTIHNSPETYRWVADNLNTLGSILIAWTDEEGSQFDILFTKLKLPISKLGPTNGGIRWNDLYVSIMRMGSFGFAIEKAPDTYPGYYEEKLTTGTLGSTGKKLAELLNGVRNQLYELEQSQEK